ncbi:MAG: cytochrome P450 [Verrucomicrobiales bacterium]|nr:cytochrome P450 [Verrucomicrobiales bacterium]
MKNSHGAPQKGPPQHWFFGNAREIAGDPLRYYAEWADRFGDLYPVRLLNHRCLVASGPEPIEEVLLTDSKNYRKHFVVRFLMPVFGNGLFTSEGDFWKKQRKLAQPAFHRAKIERFGQTMVAYAEDAARDLSPGETRDVHADLSRLTLLVACKTLFDVDMGDSANEVSTALKHLQDATTTRIEQKFPLPNWVPTPAKRHLDATVRTLDRIVYRIIEERRNSSVAREDLLSLLLGMRDDDGQPMSDRQLRDEVITLFIGGFETTSIGLSWALHVLATHPEVDHALQSELVREIGDRPVTIGDLPRLTYLEAFLKETLRLHPPAWAIGREAIADSTICGHPVRGGMSVIIPIFQVHRDARWYPEPDRFRPERWLDGAAKTLPKMAWLPFGGGPRACIGDAFAKMEMSLILATWLRRYRFEPDAIAPVAQPAFLLRPKDGLRLRVAARTP